jgi:hypothetical protein
MSDEWNIKYKCPVYSSLYPPAGGDCNMIKLNHHKKILEILRQKLIEDADNILVEFAAIFGEEYYVLEYEYRDKMKKQINKRFGV